MFRKSHLPRHLSLIPGILCSGMYFFWLEPCSAFSHQKGLVRAKSTCTRFLQSNPMEILNRPERKGASDTYRSLAIVLKVVQSPIYSRFSSNNMPQLNYHLFNRTHLTQTLFLLSTLLHLPAHTLLNHRIHVTSGPAMAVCYIFEWIKATGYIWLMVKLRRQSRSVHNSHSNAGFLWWIMLSISSTSSHHWYISSRISAYSYVPNLNSKTPFTPLAMPFPL